MESYKVNTDNKQAQGASFDTKGDDANDSKDAVDQTYHDFFEKLNSTAFRFLKEMEDVNKDLEFLVATKRDAIELGELYLAIKRFQRKLEAPTRETNKQMVEISSNLVDKFANSSLQRIPLPAGTVFPKTKTTVKIRDIDKAIEWLQDIGNVEHINAVIEDEETIVKLVEMGLEGSVNYELSTSFEKFIIDRSNFDGDLPGRDVLEVNDYTVISYRSK